MLSLTSVRRAAGTVLAGLAIAGVAVASPGGTASASEQGGASTQRVQTTCLVNQNTWVRAQPGFTTVLYTIPQGRAFAIEGGPVFADGLWWYLGHGNGQVSGWAPAQNFGSCA